MSPLYIEATNALTKEPQLINLSLAETITRNKQNPNQCCIWYTNVDAPIIVEGSLDEMAKAIATVV